MSLSRIASQTATTAVRKATTKAAKEGAEQAARAAGDTLAVSTAKKATKAAAAKAAKAVLAPPVVTKKAAELLQGAGVTKVVASEALAAGDLVFQQAVKQGLKQTDALAMASKRVAEKLGAAGTNAELVTALTNGLRPATRAKLGSAAAAGQVTRTVTGATGKVTPAPAKPVAVKPAPAKPTPASPTKPVAVKPAPAKPTPANPTKPIAVKPAPAKPTPASPPTPVAVKPAPAKPAPASPTKPAPAAPRGTTPPIIRTVAGDVALLGTAAYEAGRVTRQAADATFRAGQATRAFVDGGGVQKSWQAAWARHDQAYRAMHRELAETGEAASRWMKALATRVIAQ